MCIINGNLLAGTGVAMAQVIDNKRITTAKGILSRREVGPCHGLNLLGSRLPQIDTRQEAVEAGTVGARSNDVVFCLLIHVGFS